jgi:hypothetical protein
MTRRLDDQRTDDSLMTDDGKHPEDIWLNIKIFLILLLPIRNFEEGSVSNEPP